MKNKFLIKYNKFLIKNELNKIKKIKILIKLKK